MRNKLIANIVLFCFLTFCISTVNARTQDSDVRDTVERKCAIQKVRAANRNFQCLKNIRVTALAKDWSEEEEAALQPICEEQLIQRFAQAEARALKKGFECKTVGDAPEVHQRGIAALPSLTAFCPCGSIAPPSPTPTSQCFFTEKDNSTNETFITYNFAYSVLGIEVAVGSFRDNIPFCEPTPPRWCGSKEVIVDGPGNCFDIMPLTPSQLSGCNAQVLQFVEKNKIEACR